MTNDAAPRPRLSWRVVGLTLLLVLLAFGLRLAYLTIAMSEPGFQFADPDRYMANGASLAAPNGFRWSFAAVHYPWGGRLYTLPPLYPFVLGLVASFPGYPVSAAIGQIAINSLAVAALVVLGARTHSTRAGLAAGFLYATWGGSILGARFFMQEALYVPLVILAFLALVQAYDEGRTPRRFFIAGLALGLATLCRSMPIYYTAALATAHVVCSSKRGESLREASALVAGFALLTVPYSIALSIHLQQPTFVENHGGILVAHRFGAGGSRPPGLGAIVVAVIAELVQSPGAFIADALDKARSVFHVSGGRWVEQTVNAPTESLAMAWKVFAHATIDLPLIVTVLLAGPGLLLMRNRVAARLFGGWILLNVGLVAITGFGGARLRSPFEPHLMLLAGVVLGGGWRPVSRAGVTAALATTAAAAVTVIPQLPRTLQARGNYGIVWAQPAPPHVGTIRDRGGFNALLKPAGVLSLHFHNPGQTVESLRIKVRGAAVADVQVPARGARELRVLQPGLTLAFVEVEGATGAGVTVDVPGR
jgi:4-amino-4-deoxy-L-arabinose transferase-like glycosyltransferase